MLKNRFSSALGRLLCLVAFALCFGGAAKAQTVTLTPPTLNERVEGNTQTFVISTDRVVTQRLTFTVQTSEGSAGSTFPAFQTPRPDGRPADYTGVLQDVTIEIGTQSVSVPVQTTADTRYENDETFSFSVFNARYNGVRAAVVYANGSSNSATVGTTIPNDDDPPRLTLRRPDSVIEGAATDPQKLVRVAVDIDVPAERDLMVAFDTSDNSTQPGSATGNATAGTDYTTVTNNQVVIPANAQQYIYPPLPGPNDADQVNGTSDPNAQGVFILGDNIYEGDESFTLTVRYNPSLVNTSPSSTIITIVDDDLPSLTLTGGRTFEGGNIPFVFTLNDITTGQPTAAKSPITVTYVLDDGTATFAQDGVNGDYKNTAGFTGRQGSFVIPVGDTRATVNIPTLTDNIAEGVEQFSLRVTNVDGARQNPISATGTIDNVNTNPVISIADASVVEGTNGVTNLNFTVSLSNSSTQQVTVQYQTVTDNSVPADQRATSGVDYAARQGTIVFPPVTGTQSAANTTQTFSIPITTDNINEQNETFRVRLFNPSGGFSSFANSAPEAFATGTIIDDDSAGVVSVARGNLSVAENVAGGVANIIVNFVPNGTPARAVTVDFTTIPGTALQSGQRDYFGKTGRVTFQPRAGNASVAIPIEIINDNIREGDETFTVRLTAIDGAAFDTVNPNSRDTVVTIVDDDPLPIVSVFPVSPIREDGGVKNFVVAINGKSQVPITVNYAFGADGDTATLGVDYAAQNDANPLTGTRTFTLGGPVSYFVPVSILQDNIAEGNETFSLVLSKDPNDVTFALNPASTTSVATIVDDDLTPSLTIGDASILEGSDDDLNNGPVLNFPVTLTRPSSRPVSFTYSTLNLRQPDCVPANGCDVASNDDYASVRNVVVTIAPGATTANIAVKVSPDKLNEYREQFALVARSLVNTVPSRTGTTDADTRFGTVAFGTILNDDAGGVITITGPFTDATGTTPVGNLTEGYKRTATASVIGTTGYFRVTLPTPAGRPVVVDYTLVGSATKDGDNNSAADFDDVTTGPGKTGLVKGQVTFFQGDTTRNIVIRAKDDNIVEPLETLTVTITSTDRNGVGSYTTNPTANSASTNIVDRTPSVQSFAPATGFPSYGTAPASTVTINGQLLRTDGNPRVDSVMFGGGATVGRGGIQYTNDNSLVVSVPDAAKSGPITLKLTDGSTTIAFPSTDGVAPNFFVQPVIQSFTPTVGARNATDVTITGRNFNDPLNPVIAVQFSNGANVTNVTPDSDTQIRVRVPATAVNGPIRIVTAQGAGPASQASFTVVTATSGGLSFEPTPDLNPILEGSTGSISQGVRNFNNAANPFHRNYLLNVVPATQTTGANSGQPITPQTPITITIQVTDNTDSGRNPQIAVRADRINAGRSTFLQTSTNGIVTLTLPAEYNTATPIEVAIVDAGTDNLPPVIGNDTNVATVTVTARITESTNEAFFPRTAANQVPFVRVERREAVTNANQPVVVFAANTTNDFSVPYSSNNSGSVTVADAFEKSPSAGGYTVYRFDAANQRNNRVDTNGRPAGDFIALRATDLLQRGVGYRLIAGAQEVRLKARGAGLQTSSANTFALNLTRNVPFAANATNAGNATNGYNFIGFPFDNNTFTGVNFNNSTVVVDGVARSLDQAVAAGLINPQLYTLNADGTLTAVTGDPIIEPFKAYFVQIFRDNLTVNLNGPTR